MTSSYTGMSSPYTTKLAKLTYSAEDVQRLAAQAEQLVLRRPRGGGGRRRSYLHVGGGCRGSGGIGDCYDNIEIDEEEAEKRRSRRRSMPSGLDSLPAGWGLSKGMKGLLALKQGRQCLDKICFKIV